MMTIQEIRDALRDRNLTKVGEALGMSREYLYRLRKGLIANPGYERVRVLTEYLRGRG
jgi:DNA-binding phage protein